MNIIGTCVVDESYSYLSGTGSNVDLTGGTAAEACILPQLECTMLGPTGVLYHAVGNSRNAEKKDWNIESSEADLKGTAS